MSAEAEQAGRGSTCASSWYLLKRFPSISCSTQSCHKVYKLITPEHGVHTALCLSPSTLNMPWLQMTDNGSSILHIYCLRHANRLARPSEAAVRA